jgi:hypothetical protein
MPWLIIDNKRGIIKMLTKHTKIILEDESNEKLDYQFDNPVSVGNIIHIKLENKEFDCIVKDKIIECSNEGSHKSINISYILEKIES